MKRLVALLFGFFCFATQSAVVTWDGGGDGGTWSDPLNWSGDAVPGSADDVTISVAGDVWITNSTGNINIRSLQCEESLAMTAGTLVLTAGESQIQGSFTLGSRLSLTVNGATAALTVQGPVSFNGASLYVRNGGSLVLSNATDYTDTSGCCGSAWEVREGSVLQMPALTNLTGNPTWANSLRAYSGGRIELDALKTISNSQIGFLADGSNSVVSLSNLTVFAVSGGSLNLDARNQGAIQIPRLENTPRTTLNLRTEGTIPIHQITNLTGGALVLEAGYVVELTNLVYADGVDFYVRGGSSLSLPGIQTYVDTSGCCGAAWEAANGSLLEFPNLTQLRGNPTWANGIRAYSGGRVDLGAVTTILNSQIGFLAEGSNSVVVLTNLVDFATTGGGMSLTARNQGTIEIPRLEDATRVGITLQSGGTIPILKITNLTLGAITLEGGYALVLSNLVAMNGAAITVQGGSSLTLPGVTNYTDNSGCCGALWRVQGEGSELALPALGTMAGNPTWAMNVQALAGGAVDLGSLASMAPSQIKYLVDGSNSVINLTNFTGFNAPGGRLYLESRGDGELVVPALQDGAYLNLVLTTGGNVPITQLTNLTLGALTVEAGYNLVLSNLVAMDGAYVSVRGGSSVVLPGIASYSDISGCCGQVLEATGSNSFLSFPALTNLTGNPTWAMEARAVAGGVLTMPAVRSLPSSVLRLISDGSGSRLEMPALGEYLSANRILTLEARNAGSMILNPGNLLLTYARIYLRSNSIISAGTLELSTNTIMEAAGQLTGNLVNGGILRPGTSPGYFRVGGDYTQTGSGTLEMEVAGTEPGLDLDFLAVAGLAALDGRLQAGAINNFSATNGQAIAILSAAGVSGQFPLLSNMFAGPNLEFVPDYVSTGVVLVAGFSTGPSVISASPTGPVTNRLAAFDLVFSELINTGSFTVVDITLSGPLGAIAVEAPNRVTGTNWQIRFAEQYAQGTYTLSVGPDIADFAGNLMNQDGDTTNGEPEDAFQMAVELVDNEGPFVVFAAPSGYVKTNVGMMQVHFNEPLAPASFEPADLAIVGPDGLMDPAGIVLSSTNQQFFSATFPLLTNDGDYIVTIGPNIADMLAKPMAAPFYGGFVIDKSGPRVASMTPSGNVTQAVSYVDILFDSAIAVGTFSMADLAITGPAGPIAVNFTQAQSSNRFRIHIPTQSAGGVYSVSVGPDIADLAGNLMNQDADDLDGEAGEDVFSGQFTIALPDLLITNLGYPANALPGAEVSVSWTVTNAGAVAAGRFNEAVYLSGDINVGSDTLLAMVYGTNELGPGAFLVRTQLMTIPLTGPAGQTRFVVTADVGRQVDELNETNNSVIAEMDTLIPLILLLQPASTNVTEGGSLTVQVSRNGDRSGALSVELAVDDASEAAVPATVTIPAGQASAVFTLNALLDGVVDGPQPVQMTASAAGFAGAATNVTVLDADTPRLVLLMGAPSVREGQIVSAMVARPYAGPAPLAVILTTPDVNDLSLPPTVTILANETSVVFSVTAVNDLALEPSRTATVTASAAGHLPGTTTVTVLDDDLPSLTLDVSAAIFREDAGSAAGLGTVTRGVAGPLATRIILESSDTSELVVPGAVTIPAGQLSTTFTISIADDALLDGPQAVTLQAFVAETISGRRILPGAATNLTVLDNDGPALSLVIDRDAVPEGQSPAASALVSRNTPGTNELVVNLVSSDPSEATVPATVIIPVGQTSAPFDIVTPDDGTNDGSQMVVITASAADHEDGLDSLVVTDVNRPDLVVTKLVIPASGATDAYFDLTYREMNLGVTTATGTWSQAVYLSKDPYPGGDELLGLFSFSGNVDPGLYFERTVQTRLPREVGDYWAVVVSDPSNTVAEVLENNNVRVSAAPIQVVAEYTAMAETAVDTALAGTPVPITGTARLAGTQTPAQYRLVSIHINVRDTKRVIAALTDANGQFSATFEPLPGEAGNFTIGAAHPGEPTAPVQDSFVLLGAKFQPVSLDLKLVGLGSVTGAVMLVNQGDVPLTGLTAAVINGNPDLGVNLDLAETLPPLGSLPLGYTIASLTDASLAGTFTVRVTSAEGVVVNLPVAIMVEPLRPRLVSQPGRLVAGMLRGAQTVVNFSLLNQGGASTGPMTILLPPAPFLKLASPATLPSLNPGESNTVSLLLTPAADLALTAHEGTIAIQGTGVSLNVPFSFRALSDGRGALRVEAVDEYTYYASGAPRVAGAVITLRDTLSRVVVTNSVTDTNGLVEFPNLAEGYYEVEALAADHLNARETVFVAAGATNDTQIFLSRETVKLIWRVTPTEIEDRTRITIETVFETFVPIPVVTVEPNVIDLAEITNDVTQIDLKITNHGLIAANDFRLNFNSSPSWTFTPLITEAGVLPARSSLTIPLTIRRNRGSGLQPTIVRAAGGDCPSASASWTLICGNRVNGYGTPIDIQNAGGGCGWFPGGGGGGGVAGPGYVPRVVGEASSECDLCPALRLAAIYLCLLDLAAPPWVSCPKNGLDCYNSATNLSSAAYPCIKTALACTEMGLAAAGVTAPAAAAIEGINKALDLIDCGRNIAGACDGLSSGGGAGGGGGGVNTLAKAGLSREVQRPPGDRNFTPGLDKLETHMERLDAMVAPYVYIFGADLWFRGKPTETVVAWQAQFHVVTETPSEDGGRISPAEQENLLAQPLPSGLTTNDTLTLIDRWNRTIDYNAQGIKNLADLPAGWSSNFVALDVLGALYGAAAAAQEANFAEGFSNIVDGMVWALEDAKNYFETAAVAAPGLVGVPGSLRRAAGEGVCARVRLQLNQDAVLAREAFEAALEIVNNQNESLNDVRVDLEIKNAAGESVNDRFGIRDPALNGISAVDGTGTVNLGTTASAAWILIPTRDAAGAEPIVYTVGGTLTYRQEDLELVVPLLPVPITVHPVPNLLVDYFWQRDVFSDDPFTDEIEPTIPFSLGVLVRNTGQGEARNFRIVSSQPEIIENEKGLLIDFEIIATEMNGRTLTPSLTADFGTIPSGGLGIARWLLTSTLQGLFIDYSASFEHIDSLGDPRLSLIEEVNIHELIRPVQAAGVFEDGRPDFLVNDFSDPETLPDTLYLSDGQSANVAAVTTATVSGPPSLGNLEVQITAPMAVGWCYLRIPEPADGTYRLVRVVRSDNVELPMGTNVWTTDRTFIGFGKRPLNEHKLHLLDYDSPGSYTAVYEPLAPPDTTPPASSVAALPAASYERIPVQWSGTDDQGGGVAWYDVYLSVDGGPFAVWLQRTRQTAALFQGTNGHSYAFYSVAADAVGNVEPAPAVPDAETTVSLVNSGPSLTAGAGQVVDEGTTVVIGNSATDPDLPVQSLTFSLGPGAPPGALINPANGTVTWPTGEGTGPSTNQFDIVVTDNGVPPLSATGSVTVVVNEVNSPPTLLPLTARVVREGSQLLFMALATDPDLPTNTLAFSLDAEAPEGAVIDPVTGIFTWTPTAYQGPSTNSINLIVTDNGVPARSATQQVTVVVLDSLGDFLVNLGVTNVYAGGRAEMPVELLSYDLRELRFGLTIPTNYLGSLVLQTESPDLLFASITSSTNERVDLEFQFDPGSTINGRRPLARIGFGAAPDQPSAMVPLRLLDLQGWHTSGLSLTNGRGYDGWVIYVNEAPILVGERNPEPALRLYGRTGMVYQVYATTNVASPFNDWLLFDSFTLSNAWQRMTNVISEPRGTFYRAREDGTP